MATQSAIGSGHDLAIGNPSAGHRLVRVKFYWFDGYDKVVTIPGGDHLSDINVANCVHSVHGVNDKCHPRLSNVDKEAAVAGSLTGEKPPENKTIHEVSTGTGSAMSVGHRNHGALIRVDVRWSNGHAVHVRVPGRHRVTDIGLARTAVATARLSDHETGK